jgi:hypothetical protein
MLVCSYGWAGCFQGASPLLPAEDKKTKILE